MSFRGVCVLLLAAFPLTSGSVVHLRQAKGQEPQGFAQAVAFKHQLRVCNAYAYAGALDVYRGPREHLTGEGPMPYKACRDLRVHLRAGDRLQFRVGDASVGTFFISDLPNNDAVLLLVIHRHDSESTAVSFDSHVFESSGTPQVAIIDTFKGRGKTSVRIMKTGGDAKDNKGSGEELRYDSVVAVNPGMYEVALTDRKGHEQSKAELVALQHESYVVLRTGVAAEEGPSFPEEVVVFPHPDASLLRSSASRQGCPLAVLAAAVLAVAASLR